MPEITTRMTFRSEFLVDIDRARLLLAHASELNRYETTFGHWRLAQVTTNHWDRSAVMDASHEIALVGPTPVPVETIRRLLATIVDGHVMAESLALSDEYTGERTFVEVSPDDAAWDLAAQLKLTDYNPDLYGQPRESSTAA